MKIMQATETITCPHTDVAFEAYDTWNEDRTSFHHVLRLDAATYRPDTPF